MLPNERVIERQQTERNVGTAVTDSVYVTWRFHYQCVVHPQCSSSSLYSVVTSVVEIRGMQGNEILRGNRIETHIFLSVEMRLGWEWNDFRSIGSVALCRKMAFPLLSDFKRR